MANEKANATKYRLAERLEDRLSIKHYRLPKAGIGFTCIFELCK